MQPSGVAGSRAQRATLRQSSSPQTRQQVKASHTLRTTLAFVAIVMYRGRTEIHGNLGSEPTFPSRGFGDLDRLYRKDKIPILTCTCNWQAARVRRDRIR